jgi:hypothetical protein
MNNKEKKRCYLLLHFGLVVCKNAERKNVEAKNVEAKNVENIDVENKNYTNVER